MELNNKSIISLLFGIFSILLPILGIILGITGIAFANKSMKEIKSYSQRGNRIAFSGKICSIIGTCIQGILIVLGILAFLTFLFTVKQG